MKAVFLTQNLKFKDVTIQIYTNNWQHCIKLPTNASKSIATDPQVLQLLISR